MSAVEEMIEVGGPLPTIAAVATGDGPYTLLITWASGSRQGRTDAIDTAPQIFTFKVYRPLRYDAALFATARVSEDGTAIVWPGNADLEMSADALEELAEETMTSSAFADFIKAKSWTLDAAAAQLGISRRLVAYYSKKRNVPRYIALACKALLHSDL